MIRAGLKDDKVIKMTKLERWTRIYRADKPLYSNESVSFWVDRVRVPSGEEIDYPYVELNGAVGILAVRNNRILLVRQFRYTMDEFTWEIPSGGRLKGETVEECALREFREETGYDAERVEIFCQFYPSVGSSNEIGFLALAEGVQGVRANRLDNTPFESHWFAIEEVFDKIVRGQIKHSFTIIAVLLADRLEIL